MAPPFPPPMHLIIIKAIKVATMTIVIRKSITCSYIASTINNNTDNRVIAVYLFILPILCRPHIEYKR